jgi:hypothetical protein
VGDGLDVDDGPDDEVPDGVVVRDRVIILH